MTNAIYADLIHQLSQSATQNGYAIADDKQIAKWLTQYLDRHDAVSPARNQLINILTNPQWCRRIAITVGNSAYLGHTLTRWPDFLQDLIAHPTIPSPQQMRQSCLEATLATPSRDEAAKTLRLFKHRQYLRIGMLDLCQEANLATITEAISAVAEATLHAATMWLLRTLEQRFGPPQGQDGAKARFVVLGMGKFGGEELNFSSDIDVIFLYDPDLGETIGAKSTSLKAFYSRLGQEIIRLMQDNTAEGMIFRTDLRLRPEGESGELCISVPSAEYYYESWGQTWERAAMIKARPVAGDLDLGEQFLANLRPFVYRRYLDFGALESIRDMKLRIDHKMEQANDYWSNVKLGFGGIREIEFFIQCQQLIHGGKFAALRERNSMRVLTQLETLGLIDKKVALSMHQAYDFLRRVEHRLQIAHNQQCHSLPETKIEWEQLTWRMAMPNTAHLKQQLESIREHVHAVYGTLFFELDRTPAAQQNKDVLFLMSCLPESKETHQYLQQLGFIHPEQAAARLPTFQEGSKGLTELQHRRMAKLAPKLLDAILKTPDKDLALHHTENFLQALGNRGNYLALLLEKPRIVDLLVTLFGSSAYLAHFLNTHPQLLDNLWTRDFLNLYKERGRLWSELNQGMDECHNKEERLDLMRHFKNTEVLRIGIRDLKNFADPQEVTAGLCALADVLLARVLTDAWEEMIERYGYPCYTNEQGERQRGEFAILAMGKLGGRELNYASDLDLIFVHNSQGTDEYSDGKQTLANGPYFARLGQKIISSLTTSTRGGKLYEIDTRLRPSGHAGSLVASLQAFSKYQRQEAWTWEHQALTRARVAAGDPHLSARLKEEIHTILSLPRDPERLRQDIIAMRTRQLQEKQPPEDVIDIKQSRGGIVDIEFLVQYLLLANAHTQPSILHPNLPSALAACHKVGIITNNDFTRLEESYRFFRLVENRLRLFHNVSENRIWPDARLEAQLAHLCQIPPTHSLRKEILDRFNNVMTIIRQVFNIDCL